MPTSTQPNGSPSDGPKKSRLEIEIEEILERAERDNPLPPPIPIRSRKKPDPGKLLNKMSGVGVGDRIRRWLDSAPMLVAFAAAFAAYLLRDISPLLATVAAIGAVVALFWPVATSMRAPRTGPKTWRGREIETLRERPETPEAVTRFREWLRKQGLLK